MHASKTASSQLSATPAQKRSGRGRANVANAHYGVIWGATSKWPTITNCDQAPRVCRCK